MKTGGQRSGVGGQEDGGKSVAELVVESANRMAAIHPWGLPKKAIYNTRRLKPNPFHWLWREVCSR